MIKLAKYPALATLTAALLTAPVDAGDISGSYTAGFGNSNGGCSVEASGKAKIWPIFLHYVTGVAADASVTGRVTVLGKSVEAAYAGAHGGGSSYSNTLSGWADVRLAGFSIWSADLPESAGTQIVPLFEQTITKAVFNPKVKKQFTVGPIPVTIQGNASANASMSGSLALTPSQMKVSVTGAAMAWANGTASVSFGVPNYNIKLKASLDLAHQTIAFTPSANLSGGGVSGTMNYTMKALELSLKVIVKAWPARWVKTLYKVSTSPYVATFF